MYESTFGHTGPAVFWSNGRLVLYRYCDSVFELFCDGISIMPIGTFEKLCAYMWAEFDILT